MLMQAMQARTPFPRRPSSPLSPRSIPLALPQYYPALPNVNYIVTDARGDLTFCLLANETTSLLFEPLPPNTLKGSEGTRINKAAVEIMVKDGRVFQGAQQLLPAPGSYIGYDAAGVNCSHAKEAFGSTARVA
jgi:hypothetical protein